MADAFGSQNQISEFDEGLVGGSDTDEVESLPFTPGGPSSSPTKIAPISSSHFRAMYPSLVCLLAQLQGLLC